MKGFLEKEIRYKKRKNNRGQALLISVIFFLVIALVIIFGIIAPVVREARISRDILSSRKSFYIAEAGLEDAVYRVRTGKNLSLLEYIFLDGNSATTTVANIGIDEKGIYTEGDFDKRIRKVETALRIGLSSTEFNFGVQTDVGGFELENSSRVNGNVYSNGPIIGKNPQIYIDGDIVSAGPTGLIDDVINAGDAYAHTITGSNIGGDAYYQVKSGTTVGGTSYPASPDQATTTLPIADSQINEWEAEAAAGGVISSPCPYVIDTDTTIGPLKIMCNLEITQDPVVTLQGVVWVTGDIEIENTAIIRIDPAFASSSTGFIADNPANRLTSSKVKLTNSVIFEGANNDSYVLVLSQNNSKQLGGSEIAIDAGNTVSGDLLLYAGHGEILLKNSINLKQVSGYKIHLLNTTEVTYESGLASFLFTGGPGGGWDILDWQEVQ